MIRRVVVTGGVSAVVVAFGVWMSIGMPGMDHETSTMGSSREEAEGAVAWTRQGPTEFARTLTDGDVFVVNVHIPDVGAIAGTDADIPFDQLVSTPRLPVDKEAVVAVYCESGRMSRLAAEALTGAGYRRIVELDGGMVAWRDSGRRVEPPD